MRHAFTADAFDPVGFYFSTRSGEVWMSRAEGASWRSLASDLPDVLSVTTAVPA